MNIKLKSLLNEGIIDGMTAAFIIDAGVNEGTVSYGRKSMQLPQYSVWGNNNLGEIKIMENSNDLDSIMEKYQLTEDNVFPMEGSIKETIKKIGKSKWGVYPKKGGKRLGTHDTKQSAENQLAAIEINKAKKENKKASKNSLNG